MSHSPEQEVRFINKRHTSRLCIRIIDPVLEATIKASIENLTKRIEFLEKTRLEKWDVALIVLQLLGAFSIIVGIIFGIIKYIHP